MISLAEQIKKKKRKKKRSPLVKFLRTFGAALLSIFLIVVITGSIVTTALTIYIMKVADTSEYAVDLDALKMSYTTMIYATDKDGNEFEVKRLFDSANRIWVDIENVPQHVQDAFVYTEDERFWDHTGVDWKRTFSAFANLFLHFYDTEQGGSTITQQLIKNVTDDREVSYTRKIREIFRAIQLERVYNKEEILEAYLNYIGMSNGNVCGVQAAAKYYFNKDISEVTVAEAGILAALPKNPTTLDPYYYPENNRERQLYVLSKMYENGSITYEEYEAAKVEEVVLYYNTPEGEAALEANKADTENGTSTLADSYHTDAVIEQVINDFADLYNLSYEEANQKLLNGGYRIYSNVDIELQEKLENKYKDYSCITNKKLDAYPQSACLVMDYSGNVKAMVGGVGDKSVRGFNRATMAARSPGSSIKPVATYGLAVEYNLIDWATPIQDSPMMNMIVNGQSRKWPLNYSRSWSYNNTPVYVGLQKSLNTIPARILKMVGVEESFDFLTKQLGYSTLILEENGKTDMDFAPLTLGAFTEGVYMMEHAAAYQMFGNGGYYYEPKTYTKVVNALGEVVLTTDIHGEQVISSETAWVMNRMLKEVVEGTYGTAKQAKLSNVELCAKTGTSDNFYDLYFVGLTPDYISTMWTGYDTQVSLQYKTYDSPVMWKKVFGDIMDSSENTEFEPDENVLEERFCIYSGKLANAGCPATSIGYFKPDNVPEHCYHSGTAKPKDDTDEDESEAPENNEGEDNGEGEGAETPDTPETNDTPSGDGEETPDTPPANEAE